MSTFAILLFCAQACLVQNVYSNCLRGPIAPIATPACGSGGRLISPSALGYGGIATTLAAPLASPLTVYRWTVHRYLWYGNLAAATPCSTAPLHHIAPLSACGYGVAAVAASSGGGLEVSSTSAISPNGLSVQSENAIEGNLVVTGALPFLGAVALEGVLPTAGTGAVNYGCGNGEVAILAEDNPSAAIVSSRNGAFGYGFGSRVAADTIGYSTISHGISPLAGPYHAGCGCSSIL
ncbi:unnamed protein product [Euphydryas editha]|uniref:Uncharacterized protein n=1 Tax=Euphydryas editha TaxID=104508 RepID=A0AAU9TEB5_EUPED|nr:unnamed protein product [Euphydryas editha]